MTHPYITKCLELSERATLKEKIGIAVGEATMCWDQIPTGVFDSTDALRIAKDLEAEVFNVIDRLPKVCEALRIAMDHLDRIESLARVETLDHEVRIAKEALDKIDKLFDDADGG